MARKRMLDPTIWADEDFNNLSSEGKILFIGMISNADDEGRLPGNSLYLTSNIFPYSGMTKEKATKLRDEVLSQMTSVRLYEIDKKEYIYLQKWDIYQSVNRPTPSKYPPLTEDSLRTHGRLTPNRIEENRIEKNRKEYEYKKFSSIKDLTDDVLNEIAKNENVAIGEVKNTLKQMINWMESKGKTYKNYKAALTNWVLKRKNDGKLKEYSGSDQQSELDRRTIEYLKSKGEL